MIRAHATALACSSLILGACLSLAPPPELRPVVGEDARIRTWLERLSAEGESRRSVRAVGKLRLDSRDGRGRVKEVVLAERPGRLRLESLGLLGNTLTLLVTDGESFSYFDGRSLEGGPVSPDVLHERLGLALAPDEVVEVLLGSPLRPHWPPTAILGSGQEREVWLPDQRVRLSAAGELRSLETLGPSGEVRWRAEYGEWRDVPGGRYPFFVALYFPASELRAELRFTDVELNPALEPSLFRVARGGR